MNPLIITAGVVGLLGVVGVSLMPVVSRAPYAYGNARIRARRRELFGDETLRELARSSHIDIVYHLERNGFRGLLELESVNFREEEVQRMLRKRYFERLASIQHHVPAKDRPFFSVLASLNDYEFIITVLRSKTNPYYDSLLLDNLIIESSVFSSDEIERVKSFSLEDFLVRLRATPYRELIENHAEQIRKGSLRSFEKAAHEHYFRRLLSASKANRTLRAFALKEIDSFNVRTALCFENLDLLDEGSLSADVRARLASSGSIEELVRALSGTYLESYLYEHTHAGITRALLRAQRDFARAASLRDALGIGVVLAYYMDQRIELKNLRIILKLVHARFEAGTIEEAIV